MRRQFKKLISSVLMTSLVLSMGSGIDFQSANAADTGLHNPVIEMNTCDTVCFGNYWQEDTNRDGVADQNDEKTPILWRVLSRNGNDAYVMADQVLDCKPYHEINEDVTWESSTLRKWLNEEFLNTAFTAEEQEVVLEQTLINEDNEEYGIDGGKNTVDKVYLPSIADVINTDYGFLENGLYYDQARICEGTDYAEGQRILENGRKKCWWWLRSPGCHSNFAADVYDNGAVDVNGDNAVCNYYGVRPALHLDLSSSFVKKAKKISAPFLLTLKQHNSGIFNWASEVSEDQMTVATSSVIETAGKYSISAVVGADIDSIEDISGAIWIETDLAKIPDDFSVKPKTMVVKHPDGKEDVYDWSKAALYHNNMKETDVVRLGVVNHYLGTSSKAVVEYALANPFETNVNGTWTPDRSIQISANDEVIFNFSVTQEYTTTAETPLPTEAPTVNPYIDKDLWAKKGIHAYISYQTTTWDYRGQYVPRMVGKKMTYDYIQASGAEIDSKEAKVTDVYIDQDNATYTVTIEGIDLSSAVEGFNMLGVATDLDSTIYAGATVRDVTIKFDGQEVPMDGDLVKKPDEDYYYFMAINNYTREGDAVHYPLQVANKAGKFNMPADSIEITFTISGIGKTLDDIADGSYIDPETREPIGSGTVVSSPCPPEAYQTEKPKDTPFPYATLEPNSTLKPEVTPFPDETLEPQNTSEPEETGLPDPTKKPDQSDNDDLTDDMPNRDLTVRGLDVATDNVVKKGFLTVPRVQLTWDNNRNCDGYEIWKREGNKSFVKVDYIDDSDETEWFDTDLKKGYKYTYKVLGYVEEDDGTISRAKEGNSTSVKIRQTVKSCTYTAKRTGKKLKITFKKAEGTKYQIQVKYGKSKKWKKASGSLKKKILKKVSPKKLKVRVRTCEKVNGKMKYSKWSKVKTVQ